MSEFDDVKVNPLEEKVKLLEKRIETLESVIKRMDMILCAVNHRQNAGESRFGKPRRLRRWNVSL